MSNEEICQGNTSHKTDSVMLLFIGLVFVFYEANASSYCTLLKSQPTVATSPSLTINTVEFPDENVLPIGYNVTIVCTSNASRENFGVNYYGQPYWIQFYFKEEHRSIKECGGRDGDVDSEDSKVCKYSILNPTKNDSANYTCWSYNQITCTEGKISLEFKEPLSPKFSVDLPKQLNVSTRSKANLTCQASGIPRPVITWFKNGHRVTGSSIKGVKSVSKLIFDSVSINDEGEYWCEANSLLGWNRSSTAALTVHWKPIFKIHPQNITTYLKDGVITVTLECAADGFPRPVISWVENSSRVINESVIQNGSVSSLVFEFRESKKTPTYRCMASNSLGKVFSKEATLTILERPTKCATKISATKDPYSPSPAINTLEFPEENVLPVGYNITIVCTSNASSKNYGMVYNGQPYWITFYFNHTPPVIKECGGRDGNVDSEDSKVCKYSIQNATKNDSGNYTCWAHNQITCTEATLSLDFRAPSPPSFMVYPPKEMNISAGSKVTMSCEASGIPRPVIQWYKDGFPVPRENTAGKLGISTITIGSFTTADQGKYWCEARSAEGWNRSSSTRLSLKSNMTTDRLTDEMSFYRHPESVTAFSGDQVVFLCAVKCSSVINITWLKDGMINDDGKVESFLGKENVSSVLTINSVKDENHGNYSCLAANAIGRTTSKEAVLFITGDTSKSAGDSKIVWIVPVVTAAVVTVLVILIFAIHKKFRGADLEHNQEVKELQRFSHLHVRENNISQQISNTYVAPPHFQTAEMTVESRE